MPPGPRVLEFAEHMPETVATEHQITGVTGLVPRFLIWPKSQAKACLSHTDLKMRSRSRKKIAKTSGKTISLQLYQMGQKLLGKDNVLVLFFMGSISWINITHPCLTAEIFREIERYWRSFWLCFNKSTIVLHLSYTLHFVHLVIIMTIFLCNTPV